MVEPENANKVLFSYPLKKIMTENCSLNHIEQYCLNKKELVMEEEFLDKVAQWYDFLINFAKDKIQQSVGLGI